MTDSLRNQLLGLGFKPAAKPERPPERKPDQQSRGRHDGAPRRKDERGNRGSPGTGPRPSSGKPAGARPSASAALQTSGQRKPQSREDIDLAKAYAIRAQREKDERIKAEQAKQEEARLRREARAKLAGLVKDKALNVPDADIARHFPYGGRIKRIYVTQDQLKALNGGELGVLQMDGRYVLVGADLMAQAEAIFPPAIALRVDPDAPVQDDPYADPQYQVPDDLVW